MDKLRLVLVAALICLALSTTALAVYWIYSNTASVTVGYSLVLTYAQAGSQITLTANLTQTGVGAVSGATIHFYNCTDALGTLDKELGTVSTTPQGIATFPTSVPQDGTYHFRAVYIVP